MKISRNWRSITTPLQKDSERQVSPDAKGNSRRKRKDPAAPMMKTRTCHPNLNRTDRWMSSVKGQGEHPAKQEVCTTVALVAAVISVHLCPRFIRILRPETSSATCNQDYTGHGSILDPRPRRRRLRRRRVCLPVSPISTFPATTSDYSTPPSRCNQISPSHPTNPWDSSRSFFREGAYQFSRRVPKILYEWKCDWLIYANNCKIKCLSRYCSIRGSTFEWKTKDFANLGVSLWMWNWMENREGRMCVNFGIFRRTFVAGKVSIPRTGVRIISGRKKCLSQI